LYRRRRRVGWCIAFTTINLTVVVIVVVLLIIVAALFAGLAAKARGKESTGRPEVYYLRKSLFSPAGRSFLGVLEAINYKGVSITSKVRLADIFVCYLSCRFEPLSGKAEIFFLTHACRSYTMQVHTTLRRAMPRGRAEYSVTFAFTTSMVSSLGSSTLSSSCREWQNGMPG
jgi:hypothetical protein